MRAGRYDITIETGATWSKDIQLMSPQGIVRADAMVVGQRVFLEGYPLQVAKLTRLNPREIQIRFGHGLFGEPVVIAAPDDEFALAVPMVIVDAAAAYRLSYLPFASPPIYPPIDPTSITIPLEIAGDGLSLTMKFSAIETLLMAENAGTYSWDLYAQTVEWEWQRVLEGSFTIIAGDAQ